jgi:hypothetical protein
MLDMFLTVAAAIAVSSGGNFPIAYVRRLFLAEARLVPEMGALEPFWGSMVTASVVCLLYVVEHPALTNVEVALVAGCLVVPTSLFGALTYRTARGRWQGFWKASLPIALGLPTLVLFQLGLWRVGVPASILPPSMGVVFTLAMVAGWGMLVRKGFLTSTTHDPTVGQVRNLEATLEQERELLSQLNTTLTAVNSHHEQQLSELIEARARLSSLEQTLEESERLTSHLNAALNEANSLREHQLAASRETRQQLEETRWQLAEALRQLRLL